MANEQYLNPSIAFASAIMGYDMTTVNEEDTQMLVDAVESENEDKLKEVANKFRFKYVVRAIFDCFVNNCEPIYMEEDEVVKVWSTLMNIDTEEATQYLKDKEIIDSTIYCNNCKEELEEEGFCSKWCYEEYNQ